jgi:hypothetical protein
MSLLDDVVQVAHGPVPASSAELTLAFSSAIAFEDDGFSSGAYRWTQRQIVT